MHKVGKHVKIHQKSISAIMIKPKLKLSNMLRPTFVPYLVALTCNNNTPEPWRAAGKKN